MIRRARFEDIPSLRLAFARMLKETDATGPGYPTHDARALDTFTLVCAQRLEHDPALLAYVALDDVTGGLDGFLGGEIAERLIGTPTRFGAAHWLYVEPHARGRGVARALVRAGVADLLEAGVTVVELAARWGDEQWRTRGWYPFLVHHVLPLEAVAAGAAERPPAALAPPPPPAALVPAPAPAPAAGNGAALEAPAPPARPTVIRRRRRRIITGDAAC